MTTSAKIDRRIYHRHIVQASKSLPIPMSKLKKAPNKPISRTHAKPVKAMSDMNMARSVQGIYG